MKETLSSVEPHRAIGGFVCILCLLLAATLRAQATGGAIEGRLTDEQGLALADTAVTAHDTATGFRLSQPSDAQGWVRFLHLPIGVYDLRAEKTGFAPANLTGVRVSVGATTTIAIQLAMAGKTDEVTVTGEAPLIDVKESGVGEIVTPVQIENLPLDGRHYGNLAALVPGVGLGFHPDKPNQLAPQVAGGAGRNINYQVDGGDNNDDTSGGLLQSFPLDAVAEFNFSTQRFKAEYGRSDGGVLSVVTKSGTNTLAGSAFAYFRDRALNSRTETEERNELPKGDYRRWHYGGSVGGPVRKDRTHYFLSFERIQQDTTQPVNTNGLFPEKDGVFGLPYREDIAVAKVTHQVSSSHLLTVRYGFNDSSEVSGAGPLSPPESWATSTDTFHSANANLTSVLGTGRTNELLFQFSYFHNHLAPNSTLPSESFPSGVYVGAQFFFVDTTLQKKLQAKDDFSWVVGRHDFKAGVLFIGEPTLDQRGPRGESPTSYSHVEDSRTSPINFIWINGPIGDPNGFYGARIPNEQYGLYVQDTWRATGRLVLDVGLRYDLVTGLAFDQSRNRVFRDLQDAARAGRLAGIKGFEDFGPPMTEDKNNVAPRLGFTWDSRGNGRLVFRGGYGRYYDFAYTASSILFPVLETQSNYGTVYFNSYPTGIKNPDGTFFQIGQPLPPNLAVIDPENSARYAASPLIRQPYTDQVNLGVSLALGSDYAIEVDAVGARGRDLGTLLNLNRRPNLGPWRFADILPNVGNVNFLIWTPHNKSDYRGVSIAVKKRWDGRLQLLASYTLSRARSNAVLGTDDNWGAGLVDAYDPFGPAGYGPASTDARHRATISGVWSPGAGFTVASIFRYRSKLPYSIVAGSDLNHDGFGFDLPPGVATLNAGRGASFSQLDVRVSKVLPVGRARVRLLAEVFNAYNARNPDLFVGNVDSSQFGQPAAFAGDAGLGDQRLAQLGIRLEF